jgi:hypothetical protein
LFTGESPISQKAQKGMWPSVWIRPKTTRNELLDLAVAPCRPVVSLYRREPLQHQGQGLSSSTVTKEEPAICGQQEASDSYVERLSGPTESMLKSSIGRHQMLPEGWNQSGTGGNENHQVGFSKQVSCTLQVRRTCP